MAEESGAPRTNLVSAPIVPSLPEIEAAKDPFGSLHTPSPVIMPFGSLMPIIPNGVPTNIDVNTQLQGDFNTGPNPGAKQSRGGTLDYVRAVSDYMKDDKAVQDRHKYGRTYSYGAGYKNANFDRYYTHGKFKELGFSPYRDNDALYNERGSWWDDWNRMSTQWSGLAWEGFKSIWGDEREANEAMEKGMAIGQSTRGGFGGWVTNFSLNSAYTVGVMAEIILEDLALLAVEVGSGGTASGAVIPAAIARNSMAFGRLTKAWSGMHKFMTGLRSVDQVKDFYNASKLWDRTTDFAKWVNPAQRSMNFVSDMAKGTNGMNKLGAMAKVTKGFGQFYRDFRELNVALSEAFLEGEGASSQYQQQLLDEFYAENGRMPEGAEAEEIFQRGQSIKSTVSLANAATIYYSNKLVFEDLFEGFRPGSKVADLFLEGTGRYLKRTPATGYKVGEQIVAAGTKTGVQKTRDFLLKSPYLPWSRKYFVGNLGEALQESSQEVIRLSALDYYDKIRKDPTQAHFYSAIASIGKGTSEQFSAQGLDTFLQGYLMGSLIQGGGAAVKGTYNKITGSAAEAKAQGEKTDNDILNAANHIGENALVFGDHNVTMASAVKVANEQKRRSVQQGDEKTANDMTDELQIQYFHTLARTKNMGLITGHVDDMLALSDEDLAQAYNLPVENAGDIRTKLSTLKNRADGYQRKFDFAQRKMPNPFNPWMFSAKKNPEAYRDELDKYMGHENAVASMLFATEDYERITGRMKNIGQNLSGYGSSLKNLVNVIKGGTPVANAAAEDISILVDHVQRTMTMQSMRERIPILAQGTAQQKKEAQDLREQLDLLEDWNRLADHYVREVSSDHKAQISEEEAGVRKNTARVRPGAVVRDKKGRTLTVESIDGPDAIVTIGGKQKRLKRRNLEILQDAKSGKPLEFEEVEGDDLSASISMLYSNYEQYLRHVAKVKKGFVFDDQLNEAFKQIKDYYQLEADAARMVHTINVLSDPEYFNRYRDMEVQIQKVQREQALAQLQTALDTFKQMIGQNQFLNEIYDLGVFVLPDDVDKLKSYEVVDFYNIASKELVPYNSELYSKIIDVIEKYATIEGQRVTGRVIPESTPDGELNQAVRTKLANDKRTYTDYADQFGFDGRSTKTQVPAQEVLKKIVESKYATASEKALAKRLLSTTTPGANITFVNNASDPGSYNSTTKEILIDARYSSTDFTTGEIGKPLEHVILHEYMHSITVNGLNTDPEFKSRITELNAAAKAYLSSAEGKSKFGTKPLYGTMNEAEFIAEAMTNPTFQAMLQQIPYQVSGKPSNLWQGFLDSVRKFLRRLLKVSDTNTALDEAIFVITSKIDSPAKPAVGQVTKPTGPTALGPTDIVTSSTPVEILMTSAEGQKLLQDLANAYTAYREEQELPVLTMDKDALTKSEGFRNFMIESGTAASIIENFNSGRRALKQAPVPKKKVETNIWAPGNKKRFTGTDVGGVLHTDIPIEIMEYSEYVDSDSKLQVKEVVARNMSTGEMIALDLNSEDAKNFQYSTLESTTVFQADVIPEDVYQRFIDTGDVPMNILETIAQKIKSHTSLSPYETAIFNDKSNTKKINDMLIAEADNAPRDYKGVPVIEDLNIKAATGEPGAAKYDRTDKVIRINPVLMRQKFDEKAWTKPKKQRDGSFSEALPENTFMSYEQFETFVIEHEYQHTQLTYGQFQAANPDSNYGLYEDFINDRALVEGGFIVDEQVDQDIMKMYENIQGKDDLNKWKEAALEVVSSSTLRDKLAAQTGINFNSDYVKKLVADKEKDLAMSLTFESLTPGTVVVMKSGKLMVVKSANNDEVFLVTPETYKTNDPTGGVTIVARGAVASQIKMRYSEFMDKAEKETPLTTEEVADSNTAVENAKDIDDPEAMSKEIDEALNKKPEDLDNELGDAINNCKI